MTQGRMHTMTHVRDGFSLAHRAALMVAGARRTLMTIASAVLVALLAVVGVSHAGPIDELGVLNFGAGPASLGGLCLNCNIAVFTANTLPRNQLPEVNITGTPLPGGISTLSGSSPITATPAGALAASRGLLSTGQEFASNAAGGSGPVVFIPASKTIPLSLPQGIAFVPKKPLMLLSESFYVANFTGDPKPANA